MHVSYTRSVWKMTGLGVLCEAYVKEELADRVII